MSAGIYQIKCTENGKVYIGRAKEIGNRWKEHLSQLEDGTHTCKPLLRDWQKYGITKFEFSVVELCDFTGEELNEQLDVLEAKNGVEREATDSSTGYNYISRFKYEQRDKGSVPMLNKNRIYICKELSEKALVVYGCLLAYYDYGKHMVIVRSGLIENETGIAVSAIRRILKELERANLIHEFEAIPYDNQLRFFKLSLDERNNLESTRYKSYDHNVAENDIEIIKQIKKAYRVKLQKSCDEYVHAKEVSDEIAEERLKANSKLQRTVAELTKELELSKAKEKTNNFECDKDQGCDCFKLSDLKAMLDNIQNDPLVNIQILNPNSNKKRFRFNEMPENYAMQCENKGQAKIFNIFACAYYDELREDYCQSPKALSLLYKDINGTSYVCIGHGKVDENKLWYGDFNNCYQYWWDYRYISEKEFKENDHDVFTVLNFSEYDWSEYISGSFLNDVQTNRHKFEPKAKPIEENYEDDYDEEDPY